MMENDNEMNREMESPGMLRAVCVNQKNNWWRLIDTEGFWLTHIKMYLTPAEYIHIASKMGLDILFLYKHRNWINDREEVKQ